MKSLLCLLSLSVLSGCQSFSYYDPEKPHRGKNQFYNNYENGPKPSFWKWQWERWTSAQAEEDLYKPDVLLSEGEALKMESVRPRLTWIGHASVLVQMEGLNILLDPVFSERVSPVSFFGPKRQTPVPFQLENLPRIDLVLVSHAHYDHLDLPTIRRLNKLFPQAQFLVPLGLRAKLENEGIQFVEEFDWWQKKDLNSLQITFTPAQHWSQRSPWDRNKSLWGGWHLKSSAKAVLFVGDTGYSKDFSDIYKRLGGMDLALIPIGAYQPRWFMRQQHVDPEEAVQIHLDLHAQKSIGVHWGTFLLADESLGAPPRDLKTALDKKGLTAEAFSVVRIGETINF